MEDIIYYSQMKRSDIDMIYRIKKWMHQGYSAIDQYSVIYCNNKEVFTHGYILTTAGENHQRYKDQWDVEFSGKWNEIGNYYAKKNKSDLDVTFSHMKTEDCEWGGDLKGIGYKENGIQVT